MMLQGKWFHYRNEIIYRFFKKSYLFRNYFNIKMYWSFKTEMHWNWFTMKTHWNKFFCLVWFGFIAYQPLLVIYTDILNIYDLVWLGFMAYQPLKVI